LSSTLGLTLTSTFRLALAGTLWLPLSGTLRLTLTGGLGLTFAALLRLALASSHRFTLARLPSWRHIAGLALGARIDLLHRIGLGQLLKLLTRTGNLLGGLLLLFGQLRQRPADLLVLLDLLLARVEVRGGTLHGLSHLLGSLGLLLRGAGLLSPLGLGGLFRGSLSIAQRRRGGRIDLGRFLS
jgi:hypothetical protein